MLTSTFARLVIKISITTVLIGGFPTTVATASTPEPTASSTPKITAAEKARLVDEWRSSRLEARKDLDKAILAAAKLREAAILKAKKVKKEEKRLSLINKAYKDYLEKSKSAREIYYQRLDEAKAVYQAGVAG